ncbi:MAG: glycosyltransferase family 61 protein [Nitrospirales bacterium]|nr:glycosyltransferase family 61 protein [Nitrospira sp.]MDR4503129.1 glycosyltransferase family 61 protein [Nitrospirales bacterium]
MGHWLGSIPYIPISSTQFPRKMFNPPTMFDYTKFNEGDKEGFWDRPTPSPVTFHHVLSIADGSADRDGFVYDVSGLPVFDACHPLRQRTKYQRRKWRDCIAVDYRKRQAQPRHYQGRMAVLTSEQQHMYSHWLFDVLPRLAKLRECEERVEHYFLQYSRSFQIESIEALGFIDTQCLVNCDHIPWASSDQMVIPCHQVLFGYHYPRWVCDWLRRTFLPTGGTRSKPRRKIYVSRSLAGRRKVVNEEEIFSFLAPQGFRFCHLEQLSLAEQITLFHEAEIVVGPHGSGFANLVFCDPGTRVIELFPSRATDAYFRLCVDMGLNYTCVKTRDVIQRSRVSDDFSIHVEDLRRALKKD